MTPESNKVKWSDVKGPIQQMAPAELVGLIGELFKLAPENRNFLHARFLQKDSAIDIYAEIIRKCLWPGKDGAKFRFREAQKTISDYQKATGDTLGAIHLMLVYVETGNEFTVTFGDMDESFYYSIISMCRKVAGLIEDLEPHAKAQFEERMWDLVQSSDGVGWGYHDDLKDIYHETFSE